MVKRRWTNAEIKIWAYEYLVTGESFMLLEKRLKVPHSTIGWCFLNRLHLIDNRLYLMVLEKVDYNKHHRHKRKEN